MTNGPALPPVPASQDPDSGPGVSHDGRRGGDHFPAHPLGSTPTASPVCPHCGSLDAYDCRRPNGAPRFRCRECGKDFSITSGTLFASRKLPLRGYLAAIAIFCNEVKGKSMLALSRDLGLVATSPLSCSPTSCARRWPRK